MGLNYTKRQWLILAVMGLSDFFNAICVSLQAPFFPKEAEAKNATATEYGLVFGVFELVVCLSSPFYGHFLKRIGAKNLFNGGVLTTGTSAILFGLLDKIPGHTMFITLAFVIRIVEALGNAAFLTASFTIIASEFPNSVATSFATLETFFGLGLICGPMVGGLLYGIGGYFLPFVVLGGVLFACAIVTFVVLPTHSGERPNEAMTDSKASIFQLLKIPGIQICSLGIAATSASIGFLSATLEPHLRQFELSSILLGVMFVINGGIYALSAPFIGYFVDKFKSPKIVSIFGSVFIMIAFTLVGPVSFLPFETNLTFVTIGLVFHGMGIAFVLVSTFSDALRTSIQNGFEDGIVTYGLISGLWTSVFAFGAFIGPSISGLLFDSMGFRDSMYFVIILHAIVAVIVMLYTCFSRKPRNLYKKLNAGDKIIGKSDDSLSKSRSRSGSIISSHHIPVPMAMNNNMLIASSYGKANHWQRLEEANSELLADSIRSETYGSFEHELHRETIS